MYAQSEMPIRLKRVQLNVSLRFSVEDWAGDRALEVLFILKIFLIARSVLVNICIQHRSRARYIITVGRKTTKGKNQASV